MITITELSTYLKMNVPAWVTSTNYTAGQSLVTSSSVIYICLITHTSGTFATDLAAGKWRTSQLYGSLNAGKDFVHRYTGRNFTTGTVTEYFKGIDVPIYYAKEYPVTAVSSVSEFDEEDSAWESIFVDPDTVADSVHFNGVDSAIELYNGYSFSDGVRYRVVFTGGYTSGSEPQLVKRVALEQAKRDYMNSDEGGNFFALTAKNFGGQATSGQSLESEDAMNARHYEILDKFRNINI